MLTCGDDTADNELEVLLATELLAAADDVAEALDCEADALEDNADVCRGRVADE